MPLLIPTQQPNPSVQHGYAKHAGESAYPGLWKDMIYAFMPSMGYRGNASIQDYGPSKMRWDYLMSSGSPPKMCRDDKGNPALDCSPVGVPIVANYQRLPLMDRITNKVGFTVVTRFNYSFTPTWNKQCFQISTSVDGLTYGPLDEGGRFYMALGSSSMRDNTGPTYENTGWHTAAWWIGGSTAGWGYAREYFDGEAYDYNTNGHWQKNIESYTDWAINLYRNDYDGQWSSFMIWLRQLTDDEHKLLHMDPLAPFRLRQRVVYTQQAAGPTFNPAWASQATTMVNYWS